MAQKTLDESGADFQRPAPVASLGGGWRRRRRPRIRFGGYQAQDLLSSALFTIPTSLLLLMVTLPFFLVIPLIILIQDGWPVFYKGDRMGRNKRVFQMYKFRTLVKDAEPRIGGNLLTPGDRLETVSGRFLRETRLDELPQLINIISGDMGLVGPRPERPAVYEKQCKQIPEYDRRFMVKPGIIGYSQLFTPHSAPKKARALLDNYYVRQKQKWYVDILFFALAIMWLGQRAGRKSLKMAYELSQRFLFNRSANNLRASERIKPPATKAWVRRQDTDEPLRNVGSLVDISDEGLVFLMSEDLSGSGLEIKLQIEGRFPPRRGIKRKTARCVGRVLRATLADDGQIKHIVLYRPQRSLDLLLIHQYFLHKSIV